MLYSLLVKINYIKNDTFQTNVPGKKLFEKQINHLTRQRDECLTILTFLSSEKLSLKLHLPQLKNFQQTTPNLDNINSSHYNSVQIYNVLKVSSRKRVFMQSDFCWCFSHISCVCSSILELRNTRRIQSHIPLTFAYAEPWLYLAAIHPFMHLNNSAHAFFYINNFHLCSRACALNYNRTLLYHTRR